MKASEAKLLEFLNKEVQFVVPIYQRKYSWKDKQCTQLWKDILRIGGDKQVDTHFTGSIVYVEMGFFNVTSQKSLLVIDGQQRLTTCTLLIAALADFFEKKKIPELLNEFSAKKLRDNYLLNSKKGGEERFKLMLSEADQNTLFSILQNAPMPTQASVRIEQNYHLFQKLIEENQEKLEQICSGLSKLEIIDVSLERDKDNPQLIFESMNSTGLALTQADLIRNYILMGLEQKLQTDLYKNYWRKMEEFFGQETYNEYFDDFMRHYLTVKTGSIPKINEVYEKFKNFAHSNFKNNMRDLVAEIYTYAQYYCAFALDKETVPDLKQVFSDLRDLTVDVSYPFLLDMYHDYKQDKLTIGEVQQIVRLVESYVFRRAVCGIPTNSLNKTFASLHRQIKKENYVESLQYELLKLPSYRRFPRNEEFLREIKSRDLYNFGRRSYLLRKLENYGRKEPVNINDYTIEHIMPQNPKLSEEWQVELGSDWQSVQQKYLHTLGNLTLSGYNSEYSDHSFSYKCEKVLDKNGNKIGLAFSPLRLNEGLGQVKHWNQEEMEKRADRLAKQAAEIWMMPRLTDVQIAHYSDRTKRCKNDYNIHDHPYLLSGTSHELFQILRQKILELDPCVSEEFKKLYVAYKADTNFVDVIPQASRLRLILNMRFADINDPHGICRDVTGKGRWGNGDIEIDFDDGNKLPYIMGLIRQSFERQMKNDLYD
jgi:hypothetical protein